MIKEIILTFFFDEYCSDMLYGLILQTFTHEGSQLSSKIFRNGPYAIQPWLSKCQGRHWISSYNRHFWIMRKFPVQLIDVRGHDHLSDDREFSENLDFDSRVPNICAIESLKWQNTWNVPIYSLIALSVESARVLFTRILALRVKQSQAFSLILQ